MFELTKLITTAVLPPFNILLMWLLAITLRYFGYKKIAYFLIFLGITILYICSIPYTSKKLSHSLIVDYQLQLNDYKQAQAIVLLGGGLRDNKEIYSSLATTATQLERLRYAAYLQKATQLPLLATGSSPNGKSEADVMAQELHDFFNVPTKWIESKAKTTKENAQFSAEILAKEKINKIILVTNEWHMQRAKLLFERQGFTVFPASVGAGGISEAYQLNYMHFIPQAGALYNNTLELKEWLGYWKEK